MNPIILVLFLLASLSTLFYTFMTEIYDPSWTRKELIKHLGMALIMIFFLPVILPVILIFSLFFNPDKYLKGIRKILRDSDRDRNQN